MLALRDADVVRLEWIESASNFADLFTKILEAETFLRLRDQLMEFEPIPASVRKGAAGKSATTALNVNAVEFKPAAPARAEKQVKFELLKNEFFPGRSRASCDEPEEAIRNTNNNRPLSSGTVRRRTRGGLGSGQKGRVPPQ